MDLRKVIKFIKETRLGLSLKLTLSLGAIAAVLLLSSLISVLEYSRMSHYVSDLISKDINSINVARQLADVANEYHLDILALIGDDDGRELPDFDAEGFMNKCDSLRSIISMNNMMHLADSVEYSYAAYMLTSMEFRDVYLSDEDTREWYFHRLQPCYNRLHWDIDNLSSEIYQDLRRNSVNFDSGFYRSIVPGIVAVGVGLLLVLMLLFFLQSYYVRPILRMHSGLKSYSTYNKKYTVAFEGDDQLREINDGIRDITQENQQLRKRIASLKNERKGDK